MNTRPATLLVLASIAALGLLPGTARAGLLAVSTVPASNNSYSVTGGTPSLIGSPAGTTGFAYDGAGALYTIAQSPSGWGNAIFGPTGSVDVIDTLLDAAFGMNMIWAAGSDNSDFGYIDMIDPATIDPVNDLVTVVQFSGFTNESYLGSGDPAGIPALSLPFKPVGIAWDGNSLWVSNSPYSIDAAAAAVTGTSIRQFTPSVVGGMVVSLVEGRSFTLWPDVYDAAGMIVSSGHAPGGLAWDGGRLYVGTDSGQIYSVDPYASNPGSTLALYAEIGDGGYVQGLETVPEPASLLLIGGGLVLAPLYRRKRK